MVGKSPRGSQLDYTISMVSPRLRLSLLIVGLALVVISMLLLAYAVWPGQVLQEQATLAPTLFAPP